MHERFEYVLSVWGANMIARYFRDYGLFYYSGSLRGWKKLDNVRALQWSQATSITTFGNQLIALVGSHLMVATLEQVAYSDLIVKNVAKYPVADGFKFLQVISIGEHEVALSTSTVVFVMNFKVLNKLTCMIEKLKVKGSPYGQFAVRM